MLGHNVMTGFFLLNGSQWVSMKRFNPLLWLFMAYLPVIPHRVLAEPVFRPHMPDFYQHQKSGLKPFKPTGKRPDPLRPDYDHEDWHEGDVGFCRIASVANTLYYFEKQHGIEVFNSSGLGAEHLNRTWLQTMNFLFEDIYISTRSEKEGGLGQKLSEYIKARYLKTKPDHHTFNRFELFQGKTRNDLPESDYQDVYALSENKPFKMLTVSDYYPPTVRLNDGGGGWVQFETLFDFIYQRMMNSEEAIIIDLAKSDGHWWSGSSHSLTVSGVEQDYSQQTLWVSDPDNTVHGSGWGFPYGTFDDVPVGKQHYDRLVLASDGRTVTEGLYKGAKIKKVIVMVYGFTRFGKPYGALSESTFQQLTWVALYFAVSWWVYASVLGISFPSLTKHWVMFQTR